VVSAVFCFDCKFENKGDGVFGLNSSTQVFCNDIARLCVAIRSTSTFNRAAAKAGKIIISGKSQ